MDSKEKYIVLSTQNLDSTHKLKFPTSTKRIPNQSDLVRGKMKRAFCLYISSGQIVEIHPDDINKFQDNDFIQIKTVIWKITGPKNNFYKNDILYEQGVFETNEKIIQDLERDGFTNIRKILSPLSLYNKYF